MFIKALALMLVLGHPECIPESAIDSNNPRGTYKIRFTGDEAEKLLQASNELPPPTDFSGDYVVAYFRPGGLGASVVVGSGPDCLRHGLDFTDEAMVTVLQRFKILMGEES